MSTISMNKDSAKIDRNCYDLNKVNVKVLLLEGKPFYFVKYSKFKEL